MARKQIGVLEADVEVYAWPNVTVAKGLKPAAELRKKIKKKLTPEQFAKGQERSQEIMKSISKNNPPTATDSNSTN